MILYRELYNSVVILLSIGIAFLGSYCGITLYEQFRLCSKENRPKILTPATLLFMMALSLGGVAIWTMHFVGMGSMILRDENGDRVEIRYRIDLTIISLAVVIIFCYIGLFIASKDKVFVNDKSDTIDKFIKDARSMSIQEIRSMQHKSTFLVRSLFRNIWPLITGGFFAAAGVCVMHYIGMMAMVFEGHIKWNVGIVAASVIIALVAACAAFWILFRLLSLFPYMEILRIACALVMAIAVNGMHYTGMAAAEFVLEKGVVDKVSKSNTMSQSDAMFGSIVASMMFLWIVTILSLADLRVWYYNLARIVREADVRTIIYKEDPILAKQPFMLDYLDLRESDGSATEIMKVRLKMKSSSSPANSSGYSKSSVIASTFEQTDLPEIESGLMAGGVSLDNGIVEGSLDEKPTE